MKRSILSLIIVAILFLLLSCNQYDGVAAYVNDDKIYREDIERVVEHFDNPDLTYNDVLNNTINESVVIQTGRKIGVPIVEKDFRDYIKEYKSDYPDFYKKGTEIYGEEKYVEGLWKSHQYKLTKKYVIENFISIEEATHDELIAQLAQLDGALIWDELTEEEKHSLYDIVYGQKIETAFAEWVASKRTDFNVKLF